MNKPLVAAISGVAFGVTLTGAIIFTRNHTRSHGCNRTLVVTRTVVAPRPMTPPVVIIERGVDERPHGSACPRLLDQPLDTDSQLSEAQTEYVSGNYACAQDMAQKVADASPVRAYRIMAAAACQLQQVKKLKQIERHLDAPGRQYMVYVCQRSGIVRTKHGWSLADE